MYKQQVKNILIEALKEHQEKIVVKNALMQALNEERWITIKPHGEDSDDYRRLKLEDGETPKEAIDRKFGKDKKREKVKETKTQINIYDCIENNETNEKVINKLSDDMKNSLNNAFSEVYKLKKFKYSKIDLLARGNTTAANIYNHDTKEQYLRLNTKTNTKEAYFKAVTDWENFVQRGIKRNQKDTSRIGLKYLKQYKEYSKFERYTVQTTEDNYTRDAVIHELGHYFYNEAVEKDINQAIVGNAIFVKAKKDKDINKISYYASTNVHEFFAESFTMYITKQKLPDYISQFIKNILDVN